MDANACMACTAYKTLVCWCVDNNHAGVSRAHGRQCLHGLHSLQPLSACVSTTITQACRELMDAARVMGNTALFSQMEAASQAVKRDVVFAASLYIS